MKGRPLLPSRCPAVCKAMLTLRLSMLIAEGLGFSSTVKQGKNQKKLSSCGLIFFLKTLLKLQRKSFSIGF